jgi:hypothetical protein
MLKVGHYLNPKSNDPIFKDWSEAHAYAREVAQRSDVIPVAIWGKHGEPLCLFLKGEEFRRV